MDHLKPCFPNLSSAARMHVGFQQNSESHVTLLETGQPSCYIKKHKLESKFLVCALFSQPTYTFSQPNGPPAGGPGITQAVGLFIMLCTCWLKSGIFVNSVQLSSWTNYFLDTPHMLRWHTDVLDTLILPNCENSSNVSWLTDGHSCVGFQGRRWGGGGPQYLETQLVGVFQTLADSMTSSVPHMFQALFHFCTTRGRRNSSSTLYYQNMTCLWFETLTLRKTHSPSFLNPIPASLMLHICVVSSRIQVCSEQQQQRRRSSCSNEEPMVEVQFWLPPHLTFVFSNHACQFQVMPLP